MHGIGTGYAHDALTEQWDTFMGNVEAGIAAGWLEATTFEQLFAESGGRFVQSGGTSYAEYIEPDGTMTRKALP